MAEVHVMMRGSSSSALVALHTVLMSQRAKHRTTPQPDNNAKTPRSKTKKNHRRKKEKWESLQGWGVDNEWDDTGIEQWAKRRSHEERKSADNSGGKFLSRQWEPYVCCLTTKCHDLHDVQLFIDDSLTSKLRPKQNCKLIKPTSFQQTSSARPSSSEDAAVKQDADDNKPSTSNRQSPVEGPQPAESPKASPAKDGIKSKSELDLKRAKRLITLSQSQTRQHEVKVEEGEGEEVCSEKGEEEEESSSNGANEDVLPLQSASNNDIVETEPKKPIKLSYTSSNITLKGLYDSSSSTVNTESSDSLNDIDPAEMLKSSSRSSFKQIQLFSPPERARGISGSLKESPRVRSGKLGLDMLKVDRNAQDIGLSVATLKSTSNGAEAGRPVTKGEKRTPSQKQVMLVLKKVCLQDNLQDAPEETKTSAFSPNSRPVSQSSQRTRQSVSLNGKNSMNLNLSNGKTSNLIWMNPDSLKLDTNCAQNKDDGSESYVPESNGKVSSTYFQIGDLLPAVDSSMRRRVPIKAINNGEMRGGSATDRDFSVSGKDVLIPYEDSIVMMKEGVELVRLREKNQNNHGPPGFRPPSNTTPLHRAKENSTKRLLYGSLNQVCEDDAPLSRWQSSSGKLYQPNSARLSAPSRLSSPSEAPVTGNVPSSPTVISKPRYSSNLTYLYKISRKQQPLGEVEQQHKAPDTPPSRSPCLQPAKELAHLKHNLSSNGRLLAMIRQKNSS